MQLTLKKALDISIELWQELAELAETGETSSELQGLGVFKNGILSSLGYEEMYHGCPLCEYTIQQQGEGTRPYGGSCRMYCPLAKGTNDDFICEKDSSQPYAKWRSAKSIGQRARYAEEFVELLKKLRVEIEPTEAEVIQGKIKIVASKQETFLRCNIYNFYAGEHMSYDWQAQLDAMVASGELYTDSSGNYSTNKDALEPEEVWEDVTEECEYCLGGVGNNIRCQHELTTIFMFFADGVGVYRGEEDRGYGLAVDDDKAPFNFGFRILKKVQ